MTKKIEWKQSTIDYDALNKITAKILAVSETGKNNVESGHLYKISASKSDKKIKAAIENAKKGFLVFESRSEEFKKDSRSRGGITSGNNAKESGQFKDYCKAGTESSSNVRIENTRIYKQKLYDLITLEEFTTKDIAHLYINFEHLKDDQMLRKWITDTNYFIFIRKEGNAKIYKKVWNLEN